MKKLIRIIIYVKLRIQQNFNTYICLYFNQNLYHMSSLSKLTTTLAVAFVLTCFFSSCDRDQITHADTANHVIPNVLPFVLDEENLVSNPNDSEDEVISRVSFDFSKQLAFSDQRDEITSFIVDELNTRKHSFLTVQEILNTFPETFSTYTKDDWQLEFPHKGTIQSLVISVRNIDKANQNLSAYISPGIEIEDDVNIGRNDHYFAWQTINNEIKEVSIGESIGTNMKFPLVVVSPYLTEELNDRQISVVEESSNDVETVETRAVDDQRLRIDRHQVKNPHYFEKKGNLEYRVIYRHTNSGSMTFSSGIWEFDGFNYSRNDVQNSVMIDENPNYTISNRNPNFYTSQGRFVAILSYEYDWIHGGKTVRCGSCSSCHEPCTNCFQGANMALTGRRRYHSEYYNSICGRSSNLWPSHLSEHTNNNSKGRMEIQLDIEQ